MNKIKVLNILILSAIILLSAVSAQSNFNKENKNFSKISVIYDLITEELLEEYLETLVGYSPRMTGTYGCEKSAEYIFDSFEQMGLDVRYQNWTSFGNRYYPRLFEGKNIEATLHGNNASSEKVVIFNAHYDTVWDTPGANDDGSGTAAVLAAAYALSQFDFEHTIKFVTFSGEEVGLLGSQAYAKEAYENNYDIYLEINVDMIGKATSKETGRKMTLVSTEDVEWSFDIFESINSSYELNFTINKHGLNRDDRGGSDYKSFIDYGYESLICWQAEGDEFMHTSQDDMSNVNLSYLTNMTRIIAGSIGYIADSDTNYPQVRINSPKQGKLYYKGSEKRNINTLKSIVLDDIWIYIDVMYKDEKIEKAEFYFDNVLEFVDTKEPFKWHMNKFSLGKHRITIITHDSKGQKSTDYKDIMFFNIFKNT